MKIDRNTGLLAGVRQAPSPNCDLRPAAENIDALVIHAISMPPGDYGGSDIERLFCNGLDFQCHPYYQCIDGLRVSAHLLIRRDGEVVQFVPFQQRAWHAGVSMLNGRPQVNDFSIGIELEGTDYSPYEEAQYISLATVTRILQSAFPGITGDRIVGHNEIAPQRKTDPGPYFNWTRYRNLLEPGSNRLAGRRRSS